MHPFPFQALFDLVSESWRDVGHGLDEERFVGSVGVGREDVNGTEDLDDCLLDDRRGLRRRLLAPGP